MPAGYHIGLRDAKLAGCHIASRHVVVVGAGFAGLTAARGLLHRLGGAAEVVVIDARDHFLYLPLLPEVTTGVVEPRHIAVSLARTLPGARLVVLQTAGSGIFRRIQ